MADYLEQLIAGHATDPADYLARVIASPGGQACLNETAVWRKKYDLDAVLALDKFSFAMEIFMENGKPVLHPVLEDGSVLFSNGCYSS